MIQTTLDDEVNQEELPEVNEPALKQSELMNLNMDDMEKSIYFKPEKLL